MSKKRQYIWSPQPERATKLKADVAYQTYVDGMLKKHIEQILKPHYAQLEPKSLHQLADITANWYQHHYIHFAAHFTSAVHPPYKQVFARLAYLGEDKFRMDYMRHTGQWWCKYDKLSLTKALDMLLADEFFEIFM